MKIRLVSLLVVGFVYLAAGCKQLVKGLEKEEGPANDTALTGTAYDWKPLKIGGGGWVVGLYVHPAESGLRYVRTDVSGAYRWDGTAGTWKQLVTASSMPAAYVGYASYDGVHSLVGAPGDPDLAYMAFRGQIFKSTDRGDTWTATTFGSHAVAMEANGPGRQQGERLAIDPINDNVVYYGSISNGLWRTVDGGLTWQQVTAIPNGTVQHGVNTVVFDKDGGASGGRTNVIYVTVDNGGVFRSADAGTSWTSVSDTGPGSNRSVRDAEIGPDRTFFVAYSNSAGLPGGVWKYAPDDTWTDITPDGDLAYEDVSVDPTNGQRLIVMRAGGTAWSSTDQGDSWTTQSFQLASTSVAWLGMQQNYWLSVGELQFDPFDAGKLWFAEGFGVWHTTDLADQQITWTGQSQGIEETCGNAVIAPPGGKPVSAMWDVGAFYHQNPDQYTALRAYPSFMSCWALDWSAGTPSFIAGVFRDHLEVHTPRDGSGYSTDGGITWNTFAAVANATVPADLRYGGIAVAADNVDNMVWAPATDALPYYTTDRGATWQQGTFSGLTVSGLNQHTSPRKPLCADRVSPGTFYFFHPANGIFRSTDGGVSWTKAGDNPAANRWNAVIKAAPGHAQSLWFAEGKQEGVVGGLWHSADGGETWSALPGIQQAFSFGFGKPLAGGGFPTVFVTGVKDGQHGIYRSVDSGSTWDLISTYPLGIYDYVDDVDGDKDVFGKVYVCFAGAGFAYGEPLD